MDREVWGVNINAASMMIWNLSCRILFVQLNLSKNEKMWRDVWSYKETILMTVQVHTRDKESWRKIIYGHKRLIEFSPSDVACYYAVLVLFLFLFFDHNIHRVIVFLIRPKICLLGLFHSLRSTKISASASSNIYSCKSLTTQRTHPSKHIIYCYVIDE